MRQKRRAPQYFILFPGRNVKETLINSPEPRRAHLISVSLILDCHVVKLNCFYEAIILNVKGKRLKGDQKWKV